MSAEHVEPSEHHELRRRLALLTVPERIVLERLRAGPSARDLALADGVAETVVRDRIAAVRRKLGVGSTLSAMAVLVWVSQPIGDGELAG
jgi:DNA-binding NarL/FixJ family response regulator